MQSLQRCDLPPGAPRAIHSASKHAVKGPTKAGALEAAGNQVAPVSVISPGAQPQSTEMAFRCLVAVACRIRVPFTPGVPLRIGRAVLSGFADSSTPLDAEIRTRAQESNKGRPPGIAFSASSQFGSSSKGPLISYVDTRFFESFSVMNHPVQ